MGRVRNIKLRRSHEELKIEVDKLRSAIREAHKLLCQRRYKKARELLVGHIDLSEFIYQVSPALTPFTSLIKRGL